VFVTGNIGDPTVPVFNKVSKRLADASLVVGDNGRSRFSGPGKDNRKSLLPPLLKAR
jgi:hypothetical protein